MGNPTRRELLGGALAASAALGCRRGGAPSGEAVAAASSGPPEVEAVLRATAAEVMLDPRSKRVTRVWRYEGRLLQGPAEALTWSPDGYLGPTFRVRPGQRVRIRFENALDEDSVVHWHGLDVSEDNDGHPRLAVGPGGARVYDFQVGARPATYWYHPHPHERTAPQVYAGLAGLFIVSDGDEEARGLPGRAFELPLVLQDRTLGRDGQLVYEPNPMMGLQGERFFVNGRESPAFEVRAGSYRLRILNGSNARIYKLAWSDGSPLVVIGSDGGLLAAPVTRPYLMLAPGERAEVWADFGRAGDVALESLPFSPGGMGGGMMGGGMMGRGMTGGAGEGDGIARPLCRFAVRGPGRRLSLPQRLDPPVFRSPEEVANPHDPRRFAVSMGMMTWLLNGRPFEMNEVAPNERIRRGVTEDWEFANPGGMMALPHPIHVHGGQFQLVARGGRAPSSVAEGRVEEGWKDTFLLMPGERVRLRVRFPHHQGLFMYHCHNLEHEDMGMMRNFRVEA
jgi:blue copper oxidase